MTCFHPLSAYQKTDGSIVFREKGDIARALKLPCGQCIGCRLERSRQWAIRCVHEASLYDDNCFITLTYNPENLPKHGTLVLKHFQDFMKRLRKKYGSNIRFFHCGEYGELSGRPHYHAIIFNFDFPDKKFWTERNGHRCYRSDSLEKLWTLGQSEIGNVTFESAAYVARYIMKKINGDAAQNHYAVIDWTTGEVLAQRKPEYTTMSRRPGIGAGFFEKYSDDIYNHDRVIMRGREMRPPKFYDNRYEILNPIAYDEMKFTREKNAEKFACDNTQDRLNVRERVKLESIKSLPRNLN